MHIVAVAWIFVVVLVAAAEASAPQGSLLGALVTLLFYGALPLGIVLYLMGGPARRRARAASSQQGDGRSQPAGDAVAPEREKP